jgi:hypothetical protein
MLVGHLLVSPLIVSYLSHALATKLISIDEYIAALSASIDSKTVTPVEYVLRCFSFASRWPFTLPASYFILMCTCSSIRVVQPTVLLLSSYEGEDLQRLVMEVFQLLLTTTLHFARTMLQAARPAVSNGVHKRCALRTHLNL